MEWDEDQLKAIESCVDREKRIVPISGTAGTGKTSIMKTAYEELTDSGARVVMCAPTGKAAKRITEATGIQAMTQHRLLEYPHPGELDEKTGKPLRTTEPKRDKFNPIEFDVVLGDEYAMCNHEVHRNLLDALPRSGCIRMFGDVNQLQPIESSKRLREQPSPFQEMLARFDGIILNKIHRQAEGSNIITNGRLITQGQMPRRTEDFQMKITEKPVEEVTGIVMDSLEEGIDFATIQHQIISPTNIGWIGTQALNMQIQSFLQPADKPYVELERQKWVKDMEFLRVYQGDKVIFTVNNYDLGIFNGESGVVKEASDLGVVVVDFGDKVVDIPMAMEVDTTRGTAIINPQKDLDLAYVITTHKSQGSEYDTVVYVMNKSRAFNLNRKNLYTGISRAKKKVILVTDQRALSLSLYKKGDS